MINPLKFNVKSNFDIGMVILASLFLFCCVFVGKRLVLNRWKGVLFIALYVIYLAFLVLTD
jgi:Ca2+/Na+ antiporter